MDLTVDEFIDGLFRPEAHEKPSDSESPAEDKMELPSWFDEKKFKKAQRFFWANCFSLSSSMLLGLVAVFAVPSILRVLVASQRSSSVYTAYKRYLSTTLHVAAWYECPLKPGSDSWRSLFAVRTRHFKASVAGKARGIGHVSQRDIALTQFGFIGFSVLKPSTLGIQAFEQGDWDAFNHFWRTIGHMIGIEDRYNICRSTIGETRQVCQKLLDLVYRPGLTNVPEYFEHMARVMLDGVWHINPTSDPDAIIYFTKNLADVPGYVLTEQERIALKATLKEKTKGKPIDTGVDPMSLVGKPAIEGISTAPLQNLHVEDFNLLSETPYFKSLSSYSKFKLNSNSFIYTLITTYLGRLFFNFQYIYSVYLMKYLPYLAFFKFGVVASYVNIFVESPIDNTKPLPNAEYYKPRKAAPWYKTWLSLLW